MDFMDTISDVVGSFFNRNLIREKFSNFMKGFVELLRHDFVFGV